MKLTGLVSILLIGVLASAALHGAEPFVTQKWPEARVLVWAKPGVSGSALSASSWTQYASIADYLAKKEGSLARTPPDKDTDIILPDAPEGKPYVAGYVIESFRRRGGLDHPQLICRHLTVGKGAGLDGASRTSRGRASFGRSLGQDTAMAVHGNVTVKDGGYIYGPRHFLGDRHTFFRMGDSSEPLDRSWSIAKGNNASVTLLGGKYELADGVSIASGRLVLSPDCKLLFNAGYESRIAVKKLRSATGLRKGGYIDVRKGAVLEMRAGAVIARVTEPDDAIADLRIEGLLQIGRSGDKKGAPAILQLGMGRGDGGFLRQFGGLYILGEGKVSNFGKLAITSHKPEAKASAKGGVSIFLDKTVDFGEVSFDYLRPGGIAASDIKIAKASTAGAVFGKNCAATGDGLFSKFDIIDFAGGVGTVEFVDGMKTDCKILFPHAGRLIVRGKGNRTLQSFDIKSVYAVTIGDKRTEFSAKRELNDAEKELRKKNALWGDVPGEGQYGKYAKQEWTDCPVMIWARPGVSGGRYVGANWLDENGRPYFEVPLISQRNVRSDNPPIDMLLPAAKVRYSAGGWGGGGNEGTPPSRHLTIEYNATYGITYNVQGSLWMKHGSGLVGKHRGRFFNEQPNLHRFIRFDGDRAGRKDELIKSRDAVIGQWGDFAAGEGGTLEMIGQIRSAADRLYIRGSGTFILSEGSFLSDGNRSAISIAPGATLALLQGAKVGHEASFQRGCCASIWIGGTLMIGLPDKPISKDMPLYLSGVTTDLINRGPGGGMRIAGASFVLSDKGSFAVHSADPAKARVIFKMHDSERAKEAGKRYNRDGKAGGLICYFAGKAELNGVMFDNVHPGGIIAPTAVRKAWKNIFYGKNNLAEPEKLYWDLKK
jgi:hypothetical protein